MKKFKRLAYGLLLVTTGASASAGEAGIEVIAASAQRPQAEQIEEVIVTARQPARLTVEKVEPVLPVQLPILNLAIGRATPDVKDGR